MEMNEFLANFAEQLEDTDVSIITTEAKFKSFAEWSSLTALSIIAMVDDEYDVTLKGDDIRNSNTIQDLFDIVTSRM